MLIQVDLLEEISLVIKQFCRFKGFYITYWTFSSMSCKTTML